MFIQPRRRRGSREPEYRSPELRRERVISLYVFGGVKTALAIAMTVAAVEAYNLFRVHAAGVPLSWRLALPAVFAAAALFVLRSGIRSMRDARAEARAPVEAPPEHDHSE